LITLGINPFLKAIENWHISFSVIYQLNISKCEIMTLTFSSASGKVD